MKPIKFLFGLVALMCLTFPFVPTEYHTPITDFVFGDGSVAIASFFAYNFTQGQGIQPYLLRTMQSVFGEGNTPAVKVDNLGFLNLLNSQNKELQINRTDTAGPIQFVTVKYKQRLVVGQTSTSDTCNSNVIVNPYLETQVNVNNYRQVTLFVNDALVQEYTSDLNKQGNLLGSLPPTAAMVEMVELIKSSANAIMTGMNQDLQNLMVFGNNAVTGNNASKNINITQNITTLPLTDGLTEILTEVQQNEFSTHKKPQIYGSGLFLNFMNQQNAKGLAQNGLNTSIEAMGVEFFYDQNAATILGSNQIAVISPDTTQLVEFQRYTGAYAGYKGTSFFGTFMLPIQMTQNNIIDVKFDFQLRYIDCPEGVSALTDYYGAAVSGYRGWIMCVSKYYGLFQPPTNAYRANDYLSNTNGTLRYTITNV